MDATRVLLTFFSWALHKQYALRYSELLNTKKGVEKMFCDFWHVLAERFVEEKMVNKLPEKIWSSPALAYGQEVGFGIQFDSMRQANKDVGHGSIIIDLQGRYGIYKPEDQVDDVRYYSA